MLRFYFQDESGRYLIEKQDYVYSEKDAKSKRK